MFENCEDMLESKTTLQNIEENKLIHSLLGSSSTINLADHMVKAQQNILKAILKPKL